MFYKLNVQPFSVSHFILLLSTINQAKLTTYIGNSTQQLVTDLLYHPFEPARSFASSIPAIIGLCSLAKYRK